MKLSARICVCGCGQSFKCLEGSSQVYAAAGCLELQTGIRPQRTPAFQRKTEDGRKAELIKPPGTIVSRGEEMRGEDE